MGPPQLQSGGVDTWFAAALDAAKSVIAGGQPTITASVSASLLWNTLFSISKLMNQFTCRVVQMKILHETFVARLRSPNRFCHEELAGDCRRLALPFAQ